MISLHNIYSSDEDSSSDNDANIDNNNDRPLSNMPVPTFESLERKRDDKSANVSDENGPLPNTPFQF